MKDARRALGLNSTASVATTKTPTSPLREMISKQPSQNAFLGIAADLFPGYFAFVMATGIISVATYLLGMISLAYALLIVNVAAYAWLWILLLVRLVLFFPRLNVDLSDHMRGPGFVTVLGG